MIVLNRDYQALRSRLAWRDFSPSDIQAMKQWLSSIHRGNSIRIVYVGQDFDAANYASRLERIFIASGWKSEGVRGVAMVGMPNPVMLDVNSRDYTPAEQSVIQAFNAIGIRPAIEIVAGKPQGEVDITVGPKEQRPLN